MDNLSVYIFVSFVTILNIRIQYFHIFFSLPKFRKKNELNTLMFVGNKRSNILNQISTVFIL